ncbi:MAG: lactonase family protein [Candidatus Saccharimonadales bacterium]
MPPEDLLSTTVVLSYSSNETRTFAYVGTNTISADGRANGKGIYLFGMNPQSGELSLIKVAAEIENPSWLCFHPSGQYLYAAHELAETEGGGSVSAYAVDQSNGDLHFLNTVSSQGAGPAHLSVDMSGKYVFVANYIDAAIAILPILSSGNLGPATYRHQDTNDVGSKQATNSPPGSFAISGHDVPHAHMIAPSPDNLFVLQTDLGQDRIYVYRLDSYTGYLTPAIHLPFVSLPTGDGPRHFAFHPNGKWVYSIQEEASTIVYFHFDSATGSLTSQQTSSTLPNGFSGTNFCSEIMVSRDGRFLYAANRLHNTIAEFSIEINGQLGYFGEIPTMGDYPTQFNIDPGDAFLYACNQRSDQITSFRIDRTTGLLTFTGHYTPVGSPVCIVFMRESS